MTEKDNGKGNLLITDSATPDMNNDDMAKLFFQIQEKLGVC